VITPGASADEARAEPEPPEPPEPPERDEREEVDDVVFEEVVTVGVTLVSPRPEV